jgi:ribosomal protein S18 acetylase RimI-like enzyme
MVEIIEANTEQDILTARALFKEYTDSLGVDLTFQNYEQEVARLETIYGPPAGSLLLARYNGLFVGCVGLKKLDDLTCEMKRLYIKPETRGKGLGKALCEKIIKRGKELGYKRMRLDTLPSMTAAQVLYMKFGFREIEPYYDNPIPGTRYMELGLE